MSAAHSNWRTGGSRLLFRRENILPIILLLTKLSIELHTAGGAHDPHEVEFRVLHITLPFPFCKFCLFLLVSA